MYDNMYQPYSKPYWLDENKPNWAKIRVGFKKTDANGDIDHETQGDINSQVPIIGWKTGDKEETGEVLAVVIKTLKGDVCVYYNDNAVLYDDAAQEIIQKTVKMLRNES